jgi:hypothetical protein
MSSVSIEFENNLKLPKQEDNNIHGIRLGDMDIVYSDKTGQVVITRNISDVNKKDDFQPRVTPAPDKQPIIIDKNSKKHEIIEEISLKLNDVPIKRIIRYIKDGNKNEVETIFSYN